MDQAHQHPTLECPAQDSEERRPSAKECENNLAGRVGNVGDGGEDWMECRVQ